MGKRRNRQSNAAQGCAGQEMAAGVGVVFHAGDFKKGQRKLRKVTMLAPDRQAQPDKFFLTSSSPTSPCIGCPVSAVPPYIAERTSPPLFLNVSKRGLARVANRWYNLNTVFFNTAAPRHRETKKTPCLLFKVSGTVKSLCLCIPVLNLFILH